MHFISRQLKLVGIVPSQFWVLISSFSDAKACVWHIQTGHDAFYTHLYIYSQWWSGQLAVILCRARNEREHPTGVLGVRGCAAGCCSAGEIGARVYICEGHHGNVQPRRTRGLQISCSWRLVHLLEGERCSPWRANAPSRRQPENFPHAWCMQSGHSHAGKKCPRKICLKSFWIVYQK